MGIKLYYTTTSPTSRAALMVARALKLDIEVVNVNLRAGEQHKEDFLKLNPTHTVPILDDNGFVLWDSHAIAQYLVEKYGKSDDLYPKDFIERTLVNQRLFFETGTLFPTLLKAGVLNPKPNTPELLAAMEAMYGYLENFLTATKYLAVNHLTIADICAFATVVTMELVLTINKTKYPKLAEWLDRLKESDIYKPNLEGLEILRALRKPVSKE